MRILASSLTGVLVWNGSQLVTISDLNSYTTTTALNTLLNAKVDDSQVLTNVPSGALFTDTNTTYSVGDGGLTQKNFTSTLKTKLDGIASNANNYSHPTYNGDDFSIDSTHLGGATVIDDLSINITTDTLGHVTDANASVATRNLTLSDLGYTGATDANNYSHPTSAGNKHIPSGGSSGQVLGYSSSGTAVWTDPAGGSSVLFDSNNWSNANLSSNNGNLQSFSGGTNGRWIMAQAITGGNGNNIGGGGQVTINGTGAWCHTQSGLAGGGNQGTRAFYADKKGMVSGDVAGCSAPMSGNFGFVGWIPSDGNITIKTTAQSNNGTWQSMNMSIKYRDI